MTARLAEFAADLSYDTLPEDVVERARMFVLDGAAVMVGAAAFARENDDHMLRNYLELVAPSQGPSTVIGHGMRTSPILAAFANGALMEVLDYSDSNLEHLTHNGTPVLPAALAVAEQVGASWGQVATALIAGYEVHTRLLAAVQPGHWYRGFQSPGTFGTSGAAMAAGRLLGLGADGLAEALGISGFIMAVSNGDNEFRGPHGQASARWPGRDVRRVLCFSRAIGLPFRAAGGRAASLSRRVAYPERRPRSSKAAAGPGEQMAFARCGLQTLPPRPPDRWSGQGSAGPHGRAANRCRGGRACRRRHLPRRRPRLRQEILDPREQLRRLSLLDPFLRRGNPDRKGDDAAPAAQRVHHRCQSARARGPGGGRGRHRDDGPVSGGRV